MSPPSAARETLSAPAAPAAAPWLRSRIVQTIAVLAAVAFVVALHRHNDGLWFQGDAPRHAMNGLFWWDLLRAMPTDPVTFTLRYFARYPVISPATYPPLFYLFEGAAFQIAGTSAATARFVVAGFGAIVGLYAMAWARRWIDPAAGWAGAFVAFVPAMIVWTNTVMLNVPATAFGIACLYHLRRWLEGADRRQLVLAGVLLLSLFLTYYQSVIVLGVCAVWIVLLDREHRFRRIRFVWIALAGVIAILPLALAAYLAPVQLARHAPGLHSLVRLRTWTLYWKALPEMVGTVGLIAGVAGLVVTWRVPRLRREVLFLSTWIGALVLCVSPLPAKDERYILLVVPAFVLAAATGIASLLDGRAPLTPLLQAASMAALLSAGVWLASRVSVPEASGFRAAAEYMHERAPADAILYDGKFDGVFGFYTRALDPAFQSRIVRGNKLLYDYGPTTTFRQVETARVSTVEEVVDVIRRQCGCPWVAVEIGRDAADRATQQLLRRAVQQPEFALERSFRVTADGADRVDIYRLLLPVEPVHAIDLAFPAFTTRVFTGITPITR